VNAITLAHPVLASMLCEGVAPLLVDWLQDQNADLPAMVRLYAGTPPEYTDGIGEAVLGLWMASRGMSEGEWVQSLWVDDYDGRIGYGEEPLFAVRMSHYDLPQFVDASTVSAGWQGLLEYPPEQGRKKGQWVLPCSTRERAACTMKRLVLNLRVLQAIEFSLSWFISLRMLRDKRYSRDFIAYNLAQMRRSGFRFDLPVRRHLDERAKRIHLWQDLRAAEVIPSEIRIVSECCDAALESELYGYA
jgi:hypothetical protein